MMTLTTNGMAYINFTGTVMSAMGGLYLTSDFLGGRDGPLGHLTRAAMYAVLFGIGFGLPFGPYFGLVEGIGLGLLLSLEFHRVRRHQRKLGSSPLMQSPLFGTARGILYGLASLRLFGGRFSLAFGLLSGLGLFFVYVHGYAPTNDFTSQARIIFSKHRMMASLWRGIAVGLAGALAGWFSAGRLTSVGFGLAIGVTVVCVSLVVSTISPRVEWWLENLPDRHLGILGVAMILMGLSLQSIPDLVTILGLPINSSQNSYRTRFR
jgi:hypothetical protein